MWQAVILQLDDRPECDREQQRQIASACGVELADHIDSFVWLVELPGWAETLLDHLAKLELMCDHGKVVIEAT